MDLKVICVSTRDNILKALLASSTPIIIIIIIIIISLSLINLWMQEVTTRMRERVIRN